jgi:RNA polymerase sigma factor (sigma-70 family)
MERLDPAIERRLRDLAPQVLGALMRKFRDFTACEDSVQEALLAAATRWPVDGLPDDPRAWLIRVAAWRMTDVVRSEIARRKREEVVVSLVPPELQVVLPPGGDEPIEHDDALKLLVMCCHPALSTPSAVALTLRAVGGLTTAEIARAFLVPEATMAQRISRAKASIKASGVPFAAPTAAELAERLGAVLHVLYLIFNEGYSSTAGPSLQRTELATEAIRLTRALAALRPDDGDVAGLLALMLLTDARRDARTGPHGELIPLDQQDRGRWDRAQIAEGIALVSTALVRGSMSDRESRGVGTLPASPVGRGSSPLGSIGLYQIQAAIAAVHDEAATVEATDWPQILALYGVLEQVTDNPMVTLNRAVAVAMVHGPRAGLAVVATLDADARIAGHFRLDAVRGHLYERAGDRAEAITHYRAAARRTTSSPERDFLMLRAARLAE